MNLIDGCVTEKDGQSLFSVGTSISFRVRDSLLPSLRKSTKGDGTGLTRLGIRCEHIRLSREKSSGNAFPLPVYAIAHEAESSIVTFELENTFFYARVRQESGFADYRVSEKLWLDFDQDSMFFFPKTIELSAKA